MKKSILLFFILIFAIVLWKVTEVKENGQWNEAAVDELVSESGEGNLAEK